MRKQIITALFLSTICNQLWGQVEGRFNKSLDNINKMFPAAPTANNLMKFEEVPVSYYTGIPDVSIPLFNMSTGNENVNLDVSLKYHPLSAKPDDKAGEAGLGWNLSAGGTITRTVRGGVADSKVDPILFSAVPRNKYGIYHHDYNNTYKLVYDDTANFDYLEYGYNAATGKIDTEYDLYQYNFMGYAGRFIIKRGLNGVYNVEKLDRNNLKITVTQDSNGEVQTVNITDDKGIQYLFRGMEESSKDISNIKTGLLHNTSDLISSVSGGQYFSAYHIEKVVDQNNKILLTFSYDLSPVVKYKDPESRTSRLASNITHDYFNIGAIVNPDMQMPGALDVQYVYNTAYTKLLTAITITDRGIIKFSYEKGRNDSNYENAADLYKLKSVESFAAGVPNLKVDQFIFDYGYSNSMMQDGQNPILSKLLLKKVTNIGQQGTNTNNEYTISYNNFNKSFKRDDWGFYKESQPSDITQDVLSSIVYPTKGKVQFEFGENDYSYFAGYTDPVEEVKGKWVDQENHFSFNELTAFNSAAKGEFFTIQSPQEVILHLDLGSLTYSNWKFRLYKKNSDGTFSPEIVSFEYSYQSCDSPPGGPACPSQGPGPNGEAMTTYDQPTPLLQPGTYFVSLEASPGITYKPISYILSTKTKERYFNNYAVEKGGGLRIDNIKYYDKPTSTIPAKEYVYDYKDIDSPGKSSGGLVFPRPVFNYNESINYFYQKRNALGYAKFSCTTATTTNVNIIPTEKTQGSDVGYKYVSVKQVGKGPNNSTIDNGSTVYKFRSPVEYANYERINPTMPIMPITNQDYLRGQLIFEKKYNSAGQILSEVNNQYITLNTQKLEGIRVRDYFYNNINPRFYEYENYGAFKIEFPNETLSEPYKYYSTYGIVLPVKKTETSYSYKNGVQSSISSITETSYNANDYPSIVTDIHPDKSATVTRTLYALEKQNLGLTVANMIGIPLEVETIEKQSTTSTGKTVAKTEVTFNHSAGLYPDVLKSLNTATDIMESKIKYDHYDEKGNLQQYTINDGTPVTIIWGYNKTLPIAKIEGIKLSDIAQSTIDTLVLASNEDGIDGIGNTESVFLSALEQFRNDPVLENTQVTTYSYDPLVGVRSMTWPSGIREYYTYDQEGRLQDITKEQKNGTGNIYMRKVKEYQYNLKH
ncbi:hypothetical protein [Elizabethkingia miricola]|uniref:YD repeat-containing protein n=1 Tax=Elizabethkingia miricola TaxID=172045 RepID=A0ABD5B8I4_ELIMR|nr:hypothetical protein [Elizabethkingia miricola]MDQ8749961.1 hypothetical protein [Elizabethkingia miricola]